MSQERKKKCDIHGKSLCHVVHVLSDITASDSTKTKKYEREAIIGGLVYAGS